MVLFGWRGTEIQDGEAHGRQMQTPSITQLLLVKRPSVDDDNNNNNNNNNNNQQQHQQQHQQHHNTTTTTTTTTNNNNNNHQPTTNNKQQTTNTFTSTYAKQKSPTSFLPTSSVLCRVIRNCLDMGQVQGAHHELLCKEAFIHCQSCLGLCWHQTQPEIAQLGRRQQQLKEPSFHHLWCLGLLLAPDSARNRTTSMWPFRPAACEGVDPSFVRPWSLLAPDLTRNRTTSRWPSKAAACRGVIPSSVVPWSLLAPDLTRNRTTSRCPRLAAI